MKRWKIKRSLGTDITSISKISHLNPTPIINPYSPELIIEESPISPKAQLVARHDISNEDRLAYSVKMEDGAGEARVTRPRRGQESMKQKALDRARKKFLENKKRQAMFGDILFKDDFSQRSSSGKRITGADNIIKADRLSDALCGYKKERGVLFRDGSSQLRMLSIEDSFLLLDVPKEEMVFSMPKPTNIALGEIGNEAILLNLIRDASLIETLSGLSIPIIDRTTGRSSMVDRSGKGTYIVGGYKMSLKEVITEVDRSLLDPLTGTLCQTECKIGLSRVMNVRQIILPVLQGRLSKNPPTSVISNIIQIDRDCLEKDYNGGDFPDEVIFFFYSLNVPTNDTKDICVTESFKIRLQLTPALPIGAKVSTALSQQHPDLTF